MRRRVPAFGIAEHPAHVAAPLFWGNYRPDSGDNSRSQLIVNRIPRSGANLYGYCHGVWDRTLEFSSGLSRSNTNEHIAPVNI